MSSEKPNNEFMAMISVLESKKAAIEAAIANLRFLASGGPLPGSANLSGDVGQSGSVIGAISNVADIPNGAFLGKSIPEAAKLYLEMIRKKQTTKEIADALLAGGLETTSITFQGNVNTILLRASKATGEIVRVGNAWGLAAWYHPGLRVANGGGAKPAKKAARKRAKTAAKKTKSSAPRADSAEKGQSMDARILAAVTTPKTAKDLSDSLGIKIQTTHLILGKLVKRGEVRRQEDGKYVDAIM